jgi:tetratricopeptide (TPR) repeat protein
MNRSTKFMVSAAFALSTAVAISTTSPADDAAALASLAERADAAYRANDWTSATPLYQRLAQLQPDSYLHWMRLAVSLHGMGRNADAQSAYETAKSHGAPASAVHYGRAVAFAATGDLENAIAALADAVKEGYGRPDLMSSELDLVSVHGDTRFAELVAHAERNRAPCDYQAESRQFDFWVGDWNVVTTHELTPVGRSHIERTIGNCVIWENWTSLGESGYTGKSYNIYNTDAKRWEQFWVDNQGGMIYFRGYLVDTVMDFYTDAVPQPDGKSLTRRLRFYNLGADRVRQLSEGSADGGKTWTIEYDFTYKRDT